MMPRLQAEETLRLATAFRAAQSDKNGWRSFVNRMRAASRGNKRIGEDEFEAIRAARGRV